MAPGITGGGSGRPKPVPNLVHFPLLVPKSQVTTSYVVADGPLKKVEWGAWDDNASYSKPTPVPQVPEPNAAGETLVKTRLINLAYGRSGDKGDVCNVGIIARDPKYVPWIKRSITEKVVAEYMKHLCKGTVTRFELVGPHAFNFVLTHSLGGGGLSSLVVDRQGKTYAQLCLSGLDVEIPASLLPSDSSKL
jgi:hypothetical protein